MKYHYLAIFFFFYFIFNINSSSLIRFDNSFDCSKTQCNFNNETLWIGGVIPSLNDSAVIDFSNATFVSEDAIQVINIPTEINVQLENLDINGPLISFNVIGTLQIGNQLNITNSNLTISTVNITNAQQNGINGTSLSNLFLLDSNVIINSLMNVTYVNVNGSNLSNIIMQQGNLYITLDQNSTNFIVGGLLIENSQSQVGISNSVDIMNLQSQGILQIFDGAILNIGPSKTGHSIINSLQGVLFRDSTFNFYDVTQFNQISLTQAYNYLFTDLTFFSTVEISEKAELQNCVVSIPVGSNIVLGNVTLDLGEKGGLIIEGADITLTSDINTGDTGLTIKPGTQLTTDPITIVGDLNIHNATLTSNSTIFNGTIYQDSSSLNFLGSVVVYGNFSQIENDSSLTLTNILNNQTVPNLYIHGDAVFAGTLSISIKEQFDNEFSSLLIVAEKITSNFSNFQILTFGSDLTPLFDFQVSDDGKSQEVWLKFSNPGSNENKKQKLPNWQIALIVIGSLGAIFFVFLAVIKIVKAIKDHHDSSSGNSSNNNHQYTSLNE